MNKEQYMVEYLAKKIAEREKALAESLYYIELLQQENTKLKEKLKEGTDEITDVCDKEADSESIHVGDHI